MGRWFVIFYLFSGYLAAQTFEKTLDLELKHELVAPFDNTIKIYDIAVDPIRHRAYSCGSQTEHIAVFDLVSGNQINSLAVGPADLKVLKINPANGFLLVINPGGSPNPYLDLIDPEAGVPTARYNYGHQNAGITFNSAANQIFLADGNRIEVMDGTSLAHIHTETLAFQVGGLDYEAGMLYVAPRSPDPFGSTVTVRVYDPGSGGPFSLTATYPIPSAEPLGELAADPAHNKLIMVGQSEALVYTISSGSVLKLDYSGTVHDFAYDPAEERFYGLYRDAHQEDGIGGIFGDLQIFDTDTGAKTSYLAGDYAARFELDPGLGIVALASMHAGFIEIRDMDDPTLITASLDVGESVDSLVWDPAGDAFYVVQRLGGNKLTRYDIAADSFTEVASTRWPCVAVEDEGELFMLSHYQSEIVIHDLADIGIYSKYPLGSPEGRTDAIATMTMDKIHNRIYACLPENEEVVVMSSSSGAVIGSFPISGFTFEEEMHKAIGTIQMVVNPSADELYLVQKAEKRIQVYDTTDFSLKTSVHPTTWPDLGAWESDLLAFDPVLNMLWLGDHGYNPSSLSGPPLVNLDQDGRFLGRNDAGDKLYFSGMVGNVVVVHEYHPTTLTFGETRLLYPSSSSAPVFDYDPASNQLLIGDFRQARVMVFDLDEKVP